MLTTAANANKTTFEITDAKLYVPIVALSTEDNAKLSKLLRKGFKRSIYSNKYKLVDNTVVEIADGTFMISQLMTQLSNTAKSEKYQKDRVTITRLVVYWILLILKRITD